MRFLKLTTLALLMAVTCLFSVGCENGTDAPAAPDTPAVEEGDTGSDAKPEMEDKEMGEEAPAGSDAK